MDISPSIGVRIYATSTGCGIGNQIGSDSGRNLCWDAY
jgi:hypothetical protein